MANKKPVKKVGKKIVKKTIKKNVKINPKKAVGKKTVSKKAVAKKVAPKKVVAKKVVSKKQISKKVVAKKPTTKNLTTKAKASKKSSLKTVGSKSQSKMIAKPTQVKTISAPVIDYTKAITPLGERLVVKVVSAERVTAGGLIIPESVSDSTGFLKATVLAVGNGAKNKKGHLKPLDVKTGDVVLFSKYSGTAVQFNSEDLQIIKESDVMGIVQN